jgi:CheY-like chemotaxis protein
MLSRLIGETITIVNTPGTIGQIKADPMQIEQVILNLALNARDAMPDGGTLTIETSNVELDQIYIDQHRGAHVGTYVRLSVHDTGRGMDAETQRRVFEPFFTTKEVGKGTGLGLSMVYGIVKQSCGYIDVSSHPGGGSTFTLYLPRLSSAVPAFPSPVAVRPLPRGRESILVVEDESAVRTLIGSLLRQQGYDVLEAPHGDEALRMLEHNGASIHLLVTDLVMPRLGGVDLARCVASRQPGVKVLFMSGYSDDALIRREGVLAGTMFLRKPFTSEALCGKVREVLDQPAPR